MKRREKDSASKRIRVDYHCTEVYVLFVGFLYNDGSWLRCVCGLLVDDGSTVHVSPVWRECVVSVIVITGVCTAYRETTADNGAEYDQEDDPTGNGRTSVVTTVVGAVVTCARVDGDERGDENK